MGKNAMTTEFLKECMADAIIKLLRTKPLEKITVPEIVELAGVGRTTWFRCFNSKYEALTFKLMRMWTKWAIEGNYVALDRPLTDIQTEFYEFNYQNKDLFLTLYKRNMSGIVYDAFTQVMYPKDKENEHYHYKSRFYAGGICGILDEWIKGGFKETPQELTEKTADLFIK